MAPLSRFTEEMHLGNILDPHTEDWHQLTERVTVCPSCGSFHSLRHEEPMIRCSTCQWHELIRKAAEAA